MSAGAHHRGPFHSLRVIAWMVTKDLRCEMRNRRAWPGMLLMGLVLVLMFGLQIELPADDQLRVVAGLLWLGIFFAGSLVLDASFASEREDGCWRALLSYPVAPAAIFVAKVVVNFIALVCLECVLIPAFAAVANVPLLERPLALAVIVGLANLGYVSVGVLVSALNVGGPTKNGFLALLVLPLASPVILSAAGATRALVINSNDWAWQSWNGLLAALAVIDLTLGLLVFEFVIED